MRRRANNCRRIRYEAPFADAEKMFFVVASVFTSGDCLESVMIRRVLSVQEPFFIFDFAVDPRRVNDTRDGFVDRRLGYATAEARVRHYRVNRSS